jgi:hypothetical protein
LLGLFAGVFLPVCLGAAPPADDDWPEASDGDFGDDPSLPAVEEPVNEALPPGDEGF